MRDADALGGQVFDELEQTFRTQRADLGHSLDNDSASPEDLRMAFGRYRKFFDRLLSLQMLGEAQRIATNSAVATCWPGSLQAG